MTTDVYIRDDAAWTQFASSALNAFVTSRDMRDMTVQQIAKHVSEYADAMMVEREKRLPLPMRTNVRGQS